MIRTVRQWRSTGALDSNTAMNYLPEADVLLLPLTAYNSTPSSRWHCSAFTALTAIPPYPIVPSLLLLDPLIKAYHTRLKHQGLPYHTRLKRRGLPFGCFSGPWLLRMRRILFNASFHFPPSCIFNHSSGSPVGLFTSGCWLPRAYRLSPVACLCTSALLPAAQQHLHFD